MFVAVRRGLTSGILGALMEALIKSDVIRYYLSCGFGTGPVCLILISRSIAEPTMYVCLVEMLRWV